jgi:hypothetical protein
MMQFLDQTGLLYPDFNKFMGRIDRINPLYAFIFSIFRLGQPTERSYLDGFLPSAVIDALLETGLLEQKGKYYQMPQIGILPLGGMYFATGLPKSYPTVLRDSKYVPVNQSIPLMMDEIASQPVGDDFLEFRADYGILANMAAAKGFKNVRILPKCPEYIPFIQLNFALNNHQNEIITDVCCEKYDLIVCIHLSVMEKIEIKNRDIPDEKDTIQMFSIFRQMKETGQAILLLESAGTIDEITVNEGLKEVGGFNIQSVVLDKIQYPPFVMANSVQSSWEKQFELVPYEYDDYARKTIESSESKIFVFNQLLKINRRKEVDFVLYPFYNPKYTDPVFNYASFIV